MRKQARQKWAKGSGWSRVRFISRTDQGEGGAEDKKEGLDWDMIWGGHRGQRGARKGYLGSWKRGQEKEKEGCEESKEVLAMALSARERGVINKALRVLRRIYSTIVCSKKGIENPPCVLNPEGVAP